MPFMKKKILIVDDEIRIRQMYMRMFAEAGFAVRGAGDARDTVSALLREDFDLILLDINMPIIDGKSVFAVIREHDPDVKVIISSVYPIDRQRSLIPLAQDYYDKSQGPLVLLDKVADVLCDGSVPC
jgi:DNA-binding response OmpR family regulator